MDEFERILALFLRLHGGLVAGRGIDDYFRGVSFTVGALLGHLPSLRSRLAAEGPARKKRDAAGPWGGARVEKVKVSK